MGRTDHDFFPKNLADKYRADDARVMETQQMLNEVESNQRHDGEKSYVQVIKTPVLGADGAVVGVQVIFWDVTDRMRAEDQLRESEARKRAIFESAMDCILFMDHEGRIVEANRAVLATFGHRPKELVDRDVADVLVPPDARARFRDHLSRYSGGGEMGSMLGRRQEATLIRKDNSQFVAELAVQPIPLQGTGGFAIFLRDITERKESERVLREAKDVAEAASRAKVCSSPT